MRHLERGSCPQPSLQISEFWGCFKYFFGCTTSQHAGSSIFFVARGTSLAATCELLVVAWGIPDRGDGTQAPPHWEHSLSRWTTWDVPQAPLYETSLTFMP